MCERVFLPLSVHDARVRRVKSLSAPLTRILIVNYENPTCSCTATRLFRRGGIFIICCRMRRSGILAQMSRRCHHQKHFWHIYMPNISIIIIRGALRSYSTAFCVCAATFFGKRVEKSQHLSQITIPPVNLHRDQWAIKVHSNQRMISAFYI